MKLDKSIITLSIVIFAYFLTFGQTPSIYSTTDYVPLLRNKNIGLVVNHTSYINNTHLVDSLIQCNLNINVIFAPEHGFLGKANAGEHVDNSTYRNIPVISLYGNNKKPKSKDLNNIDIVVFDIQDVGVRFYTYISTLHYVMEACAINNVQLIVLDRPNPHAHYVDGPVLEKEFQSFVGMHPVPIVYGMTIGEYALMINGEGWLKNDVKCNLKVVAMKEFSRFSSNTTFSRPPSPNLRNLNAVLLYPSLCLFEGTLISVGRGTDKPFEIFGSPFLQSDYSFIPEPNFGSSHPKYVNELCYGYDLDSYCTQNAKKSSCSLINLDFLIEAFSMTPDTIKSVFFNDFFHSLAGTKKLKQQLVDNYSVNEIRKSWEPGMSEFMLIRNQYLLYD